MNSARKVPALQQETGAPDAEVAELAPRPGLFLPRIRVECFVQDAELAGAIDAAAGDRRATRGEIVRHEGGFAEAIARYRDHPPPDLLVIEDAGTAERIAWSVEALAEFCPPETRLIVIGERNDVGLYRHLIRMGVSDYLVQPVRPPVLLDALVSIFADEEETRGLGQVLAVMGARGGVGASTVAHNVAAALNRRFGASTLLIDADVGFGTAALQFDISSPYSLADALNERGDLNGEVLEKLTYWRDKRFGVLPAPDRADQMATPDPEMLRHVVEQARRIAHYVVLDLPRGWTPQTAELLAASDRVALVATPDLPALRNSQRLLEMIRKVRPNDEPPHLVLNRVPVRGKPTVAQADFTRILEKGVTAAIPFTEAAPAAEMAGRVLVETEPSGPASTELEALAANLVGREAAAAAKGARSGLLGLFSRRGG